MRLKIFRVQIDQFLALHKKSNLVARKATIANPFPDDARVIRIGYDETGWMLIVVESATFDDVAEGNRIPDLPAPTFTAVLDTVTPAIPEPTPTSDVAKP